MAERVDHPVRHGPIGLRPGGTDHPRQAGPPPETVDEARARTTGAEHAFATMTVLAELLRGGLEVLVPGEQVRQAEELDRAALLVGQAVEGVDARVRLGEPEGRAELGEQRATMPAEHLDVEVLEDVVVGFLGTLLFARGSVRRQEQA
ncbi:hypothetical protein IAE22_27655 [Bacillus sp. S34]|nr:hypothetical protein [Bacillus sp. S34]